MLDLKAVEALSELEKAGWEEVWKPIPGRHGYEASDFGNIRSFVKRRSKVCRRNGRILKPATNRGYKTVALPNERGIYQTQGVHRYVMLAFVGPPPPGMEVAHLNGNPSDNRLANLKYCTRKENHSHKRLHGTHNGGENNHQAILQGWQVEEILYLAQRSVTDRKIAELFDVPFQCVNEIIRGRNWADRQPRIPDRKLVSAHQSGGV